MAASRVGQVGRYLRDGVVWLLPTRPEVWAYGLGSFLPALLLCVVRVIVMHQMDAKPTFNDHFWVMQGEVEFWSIWAFVWAYVARIPVRGWRFFVRFLFHVCNAVLLATSVAELGFFLVTGARADLDTVFFGLADFWRVWPVVASELTAAHYVGTAGVLLVSLIPLVWRPKTESRGWLGVLAVLTLAPAVQMETMGRQKPSRSMKALQKTFVEALYFEATARVGDRTLPPAVGDLQPIRISVPATPYNVVLIVLESVGARRTTVYNPGLKTTPALAERAAMGLTATTMYAAVPHTSKALVTTLCGHWPDLTGDAREAKPGSQPGNCLPRLLREHGYRTAFFQTAREDFEDRVDMAHQMGFETFRSKDTLSGPLWEKNNYFGIDDRAMLAPGIDWSKGDSSGADAGRPFFATYLTLASHHDYKSPGHWKLLDFPKASGRLEKYFNAIRYVDDFLDRLVRGYEEAGLADNTAFIVLGDHGEGFGEHGRYQHDLTIYDEGLHIPFVMWGDKALGGRTGKIDGLRQQIDILPTVLDIVGAKVETGKMPGTSLLSPPDRERVLFHSCWRTHRCLARREKNKVYLYHFGDMAPQLFEFIKDYGQKKDLAGKLSSADAEKYSLEVRQWWGRVRGRYEARREYYLQAIQRPDENKPFATWGNGALSLLGCEAESGTVIPGEQAWVTCRWRAERHLRESWTLTPQIKIGTRVGKDDWTPFMGVHKMWTWRPGWSIDETFRIKVPLYSKAGAAKISVGWTRIGGMVVKTDDGKESVDVATVVVVGRPTLETKGREGIELEPRLPWPAEFDLPDLVENPDGTLVDPNVKPAAGETETDDSPDPAGTSPVPPAGTLDDDLPVDDDRDAPSEI